MKTINFTKDGLVVPIRFEVEENTIWMTQNEMATLFSTSQPNISKRIKLLGDFLKENASTHNSELLVAQDGKRRKMSIYNLDVIRLIGFKIDPVFTNNFISWCNEQLNGGNKQLIPIGSNIIRFDEDNIVLDVQVVPSEDTVYLSQEQIALLFDTTIPNISMHIKNIYDICELEKKATIKDFLTVQIENGREVTRNITQYNLDVIMSIGYRVNSKKGIIFRRWATKVLKQYSLNGYAVNDKRVSILESNYSYVQEDIKDIKKRVEEIENVVKVKSREESLFYEGEVFDGYDFMCKLVRGAEERIVLIDPYIDEVALSILKNKIKSVKAIIITTNRCNLSETDIDLFIKQYGEIKLKKIKPFHDRFVLIDNSLFILGPSINRIGHHISAVVKTNNKEMLRSVEKMCLDES